MVAEGVGLDDEAQVGPVEVDSVFVDPPFRQGLWEAGGDILTPDDQHAAFNSEAGVKALTTLQQMAVTDKSLYVDTTNQEYSKLFTAGKVGMLVTGPWDLGTFSDVDYGVQIMPTYTGSAGGIRRPSKL